MTTKRIRTIQQNTARFGRRALLTTAAGLLVYSGPAAARTCVGVRYPDSLKVAGKKLQLNGIGIREATVLNIDVYVAALYLEKKSRNGEQIAKSEQLKHIILKFVRKVDRDEMNEAIEEGFRKNAGGGFDNLKPQIEQFKRQMSNIAVGDKLAFTYMPGQGLRVDVPKKKPATIPLKAFADVFFRIWLGPNPPNSGLKRGLLGGACD